MERSEWLNSLEVGNVVAVGYGYGNDYVLRKVKRITKTIIVVSARNVVGVEYEQKFKKTNGFLQSSDYSRDFITKPTQEILDGIEYKQLHKWLNNLVTITQSRPVNKALLKKLKACYDQHCEETYGADCVA